MRTNAEFVSRIVNDIKGLSKDGRVNRRQILAIGQDKARFLMAQKLDELTLFREEGIISYIPCVEFEEVPLIECDFIDIRVCKSLMKSKKPLPDGIFGKTGAGIIEVSSIDNETRIAHTTLTQQRNTADFKYKRKQSAKYLVRNGYMYITGLPIEAVNLTMFVIEPYKMRDLSACCTEEDICKSNWDYPFICPDRFLDVVTRDTLMEMAQIYRAMPDDSNPNLDPNIKGKDTQ
jgi:hypothetical protein